MYELILGYKLCIGTPHNNSIYRQDGKVKILIKKYENNLEFLAPLHINRWLILGSLKNGLHPQDGQFTNNFFNILFVPSLK